MNRPAPLTPPSFGPDDPRLTAYALDALDATDRALVEAALAADPALRAVVDETRVAAATLTAALPRDGESLTALQRQAILAQQDARPGGLRRWTAFGIGATAAAAILLAVGLRATSTVAETRLASVNAPVSLGSGSAGGSPTGPGGPANRVEIVFNERLGDANGRNGLEGPDVALTHGARGAASRVRVAPQRGVESFTAWRDDMEATRNLEDRELVWPGQEFWDRITRARAADKGREVALTFLGLQSPGTATTANWNGAYRFVGTPELEALRGLPAGKVANVTLAGRVFRAERRGAGLLIVAGDVGNGAEPGVYFLPDGSNEAYATVPESPFLRVADARLSTFSIDVDTASYANVRRMLTAGQRPPPAAVRVEELVNYFPYEYPAPTGTDPFAVHLEVAECPWDGTHRLVRVGIQGRALERKARPPMNLVFLVDVSGSMNAPDKLPLVQASLRMLLEELNARDSVAIVVYAGASGLALPPTWCEQKAGIQQAIDALRPGGSTNGAAGIELAYEIATQRFVKDGVNRVVLATDGDFNVGVTSQDALHALIAAKAKSGVFLTCLGFGMGNLKDATLELLADKGNGNYGYIDSTREARKVLVDEASGTLVTIAKDVKLQVEFNPATVASYRLIGYDNRRLADRDFADDTKDAGEVGAGHRVTALYEVVPVGAPGVAAPPSNDEPLRYGPTPTAPVVVSGVDVRPGELLTVKVRWKEPAGVESTKREFPLVDGGASYGKASRDFRFAASVAAFGMLLRSSPYAARISWDAVAEWASEGLGFDPGGYRAEFIDLLAKAKSLPR